MAIKCKGSHSIKLCYSADLIKAKHLKLELASKYRYFLILHITAQEQQWVLVSPQPHRQNAMLVYSNHVT